MTFMDLFSGVVLILMLVAVVALWFETVARRWQAEEDPSYDAPEPLPFWQRRSERGYCFVRPVAKGTSSRERWNLFILGAVSILEGLVQLLSLGYLNSHLRAWFMFEVAIDDNEGR